jgi:beta-glucosidase
MPAATELSDTRAEARASSASAIDRAEGLLRQMTIEEKAMQLSSVFPLALFDTQGTNRAQLDALLKHGIGHVSALGLIGHKTPETLAKSVNAIQRYLVTETRLKIPAIFHNEAMSGVVAPHFTAFPTSIGLAATWDPVAAEEMADIIRRQMRAVGMLQALAPVMDVARDARWGRVSETYGEDPYLVSAMSVAYTRGLQGKDLTNGVLATAKHFIGYAVTEGGQNMAATAVGARESVVRIRGMSPARLTEDRIIRPPLPPSTAAL